MKGHGEKLSNKQELAIAALLKHSTHQEAAKAVGIGETTLYRWMRNEEQFREAYRNAKQQVVGQAITHLQQVTGEAVKTLQEVMNNKESPPSSRVSAAKAVLETAIKATEIEELLSRIEKLEQLNDQ